MESSVQSGSLPGTTRSRGDVYEGIAFTFCKAATLALFFQLLAGSHYVLPAIAIGTAALYGLMLLNGRYTSRCIIRPPWLIIVFWGAVATAALLLALRGADFPSLLGLLTP